jgi:hypothetical protein
MPAFMNKKDNSDKEKFFAVNAINWGHKWGYRDSTFIMNDDRSVSMTGSRYELCGILFRRSGWDRLDRWLLWGTWGEEVREL